MSSRLSIYLLRHGQTDLSRDNRFGGARSDPALTAEGREMAQAFADIYRTISWNAIIASPQTRARTTAAPLATATGLTGEIAEGLKEIDLGLWEGLTVDEVTQRFPEDYARWSADPAKNPPTQGETALQVAHRGRHVIESVRSRFSSGNVVLVSHKATIRLILCDLFGIEPARYRDRLACPVGSVSMVEFGSRGPMLKMVADRSHQSERLRSLPGT